MALTKTITKIWPIIFLLICGVAHAAQLVCIAPGTYHTGLNNVGDIVAIHRDVDRLGGPGYANYKIYAVKGTVDEVRSILSEKLPDTSSLTEEEIKERLSTPKYQSRVTDDKEAAIADMCSTNVILSDAEVSK